MMSKDCGVVMYSGGGDMVKNGHSKLDSAAPCFGTLEKTVVLL